MFIGPPAVLTAGYALELPELSADRPAISRGGRLLPATRTELGPGHAAIMARARSAEAVELLVPLLARVLTGERSVTMPWTEPSLPEAVMWGKLPDRSRTWHSAVRTPGPTGADNGSGAFTPVGKTGNPQARNPDLCTDLCTRRIGTV